MLRPLRQFPNIAILDLKEELDRKRLLLLMSGAAQELGWSNFCSDSACDKASARTLPRPNAVFLNFVTGKRPIGLGTVCAVVEWDYYDRDTNVAYIQLSSRAYRDYPRRTVRLHFFSTRLTYRRILDTTLLQAHYLGFCVLSPAAALGGIVKLGTISKAVLAAPLGFAHKTSIVPTVASFPVNLAGNALRIVGTGFIEQDERISACASAAIWMSTAVLGRRFNSDTDSRSIAEITQLATQYSVPGDGFGSSPGLDESQMLLALSKLGYEPVIHRFASPDDAHDAIHAYVSSGIPPILLMCLQMPNGSSAYHAATVVGYDFDRTATLSLRGYPHAPDLPSGWFNVSDYGRTLLLHDDRIGPYIRVRLDGTQALDNNQERPRICLEDHNPSLGSFAKEATDWYHNAWLDSFIVPMPPRNLLRYPTAAHKGISLIEEAFSTHDRYLRTFPERALYRTYLASSNDYKSHFVPNTQLAPSLASWYRGTSYPRYVWVTELCKLASEREHMPVALKVIADAVVDPTSSGDRFDFLSIRLPKAFLRMGHSETEKVAMEHARARFTTAVELPPYLPRAMRT